jgi:hypothetical protein
VAVIFLSEEFPELGDLLLRMDFAPHAESRMQRRMVAFWGTLTNDRWLQT